MSLNIKSKGINKMKYNNSQKIVSEISGYDHENDYTGAKNDLYYECNSHKEKLNFIVEYSKYADDITCVNEDEAEKILAVLDLNSNSSNDHYHAFIELGKFLSFLELEEIALDFDKYCDFHGGKNLETESEFYDDQDIAGRIEYLRGAING